MQDYFMNTKILNIFLVFMLFFTPLFSKNSKSNPSDQDSNTNASKNTKSATHKKTKSKNLSDDTESKDRIWTEEERQQIIEDLNKKIEESRKELESLARNGSYFGIEYECATETTGCVLNIGFLFYAQYYFGQSQKNGIRVSTHFITYADSNNDFSKTPSLMKIGLDVKYLYDIWTIKDFTFGINIGLGYQKSFLFDSQKYKSTRNISESQKAISELKYNFVNVAGIHIRYHFYQLEILSGYPNYFRATIAYRY